MRQRKSLRHLNRILRKVKRYKDVVAALTDKELAGLTVTFKERLEQGASLDDILPEAYAAVCEADYRVLGKYPYDSQIRGAIALHEGNLIEMNTGEGKTLVATLPLYLNALTGKSTILLTTNEYLALRDAQEMGQVYRFMGLTVAAGVHAKAEERFTNDEKREIYASDIVYTTHGVFGFDYLLNNLVTTASDRFMRELYYVIIDEADSVLLDSAQTPLVISGAPRVQSNLYELADFFVTTLVEGRDYEKEDNKVWLTEEGIAYTERFFQIDNFYGEKYFEINRHVTLALRAHALFEIEKDYMLSKDGELQLLDNGSGRMMPGVKLRGGQHQALEVKEKLEISKENRSVAAITYQNLFLLFPKMSGMSGTISDAAEELADVYGANVIVIPPNCPVHRKDLKDYYFKNIESQFSEAIGAVVETHKTGQPVLVVVSTIGETELVSKLLIEEKIPHNVLNANNAFWEADIIKEAGQMNAVTVATAMAGRGTDIRLGEGVKELGGLAVIGIGRMANIRQERQARGRAGRQGDPGFSRFFVSIQDEVVRRNGLIDSEKYADGKRYISRRKLKKVINTAQKTGEEFAVMSRKQAMDYDQVMQRQRKLIYATRDRLLDGGAPEEEKILTIARDNIEEFLSRESNRDMQSLSRYILDNISYRLSDGLAESFLAGEQSVIQYLLQVVSDGLKEQEEKLGSRERMSNFVRIATLQAIDDAWVEQVDYLQQLQAAVAGRSVAQRKPVYEYQKDALESFRKMEKTILKNVIRNILLSNVYVDAEEKLHMLLP
ncbi:MAG: accessory Sec system translocase SecA2 [Lachnospiraceae bacterium]|nr:accessory Sec system translocase SecA2 [Lachnospiraceae bacterium]